MRRGKTDAADAEAAARPGQRTVPAGPAERQARAMLSVRELLVRSRTALVNALRGHVEPRGSPDVEPRGSPDAAGFGLVAPLGDKGVALLLAEAAGDAALPAPAAQALALPGSETDRPEARLAEAAALRSNVRGDAKLLAQHKATPESKMLAAVPGVGPLGGLSFALRVDAGQFRSGRHFAMA